METINACEICGGLAFVCPFHDKDRGVSIDEGLYVVRCYICNNIISIEYSENEAIAKWNAKNNYKIDEDEIKERLFVAEQKRQNQKLFGDAYEPETYSGQFGYRR